MARLRRSLPFLALALAAALVIAWTTTPAPEPRGSTQREVPASPLIGTWAVKVPDLEDARSMPSSQGTKPDSDEALRSALRRLDGTNVPSVRITYRADRTGVIVTTAPGVDRKQPFTWGLLSASPDQIKIDQETSDPPRLERITYKIDPTGKMTITDGATKGSVLERAK